jgi:glycerol uptake facilitator protein
MNPYIAEFAGTAFLILLGCGVNASVTLKHSFSNGAGWLTVCLGWGLAVMLAVYATGKFSGGHLNPAVSLAFAIKGDFPWSQLPGYVLAQVAGAITGAVLVFIQFRPHWEKTESDEAKLGVFATSPAIQDTPANFISEVIGTMGLVLGLLFIGTNEFTQGLNPLITGLLIVSIGLSLGGTTGFAINPARDLGPRIAHAILPIKGKGASNWGYSWIPVIGPLVGAVIAVKLFELITQGL